MENAPLAIGCLRHNLAAVCRCLGRGLDDLAIRRADVLKFKWEGLAVPDLVFVDPPYELLPVVVPRLFPRLDALLSGHPEALVVLEFPGGAEPEPSGWHCVRQIGRGGARQPNVRIFQRQSST